MGQELFMVLPTFSILSDEQRALTDQRAEQQKNDLENLQAELDKTTEEVTTFILVSKKIVRVNSGFSRVSRIASYKFVLLRLLTEGRRPLAGGWPFI